MRLKTFLILGLLVLVWIYTGCTAKPKGTITANVSANQEKATVLFKGKKMGPAPVVFKIKSMDDVLGILAKAENQNFVEKRVHVISLEEVQVSFYFGEPQALAKTLGLAKMLVFDYAEHSTFDLNRWDLKAPVIPILEKQAQMLNTHFKELKIYICGHTDSTGSPEYNLELSLKRAQEVANFLVSKGVDRTRMTIQGMGQDYPLADNNTETGRGQNRRTEVILPQ